MAKLSVCAALAACLFVASTVRADLKGSCDDAANWYLRNDATVPGTYSSLSVCQQTTMGLKDTNNIELGGKGGAEVVGIPAGSGSGGCTDPGRQCMSWCQSLCCIAKGCVYAHIYAKEKTTDYGVYKEKTTMYICQLWSAGSYKGSSNQVTCKMNNNVNCPALMQQNFKVNSTTYQYLIYNNANSVCMTPPSSGRRLMDMTGGANLRIKTPIPDPAELNKAISNFPINKEMLKKMTQGNAGKNRVCKGLKAAVKKSKC